MGPLKLGLAGVLLVVAAVASWFALGHLHSTPADRADYEQASRPDGAAVTLRFFRDPTPVPGFTVRDLDGRTISSSDFRGKVTIINFWATWCPPCRAEIPDLIALQRRYAGRLQIIGISEDEIPAEQVRQFAVANGMNYPTAMLTPELEKLFPGITALPTSYILDRDARVVQRHAGMLNAALTDSETRSLAGLPVAAKVEQVDRVQKAQLDNGAQAISIPGVDLKGLKSERRAEALQKLNAEACTCGCDLSLAKCRIDDPSCGISLPLAKKIVQQIAAR
jgi:thiol-disulfide isomerase/thioredoxin